MAQWLQKAAKYLQESLQKSTALVALAVTLEKNSQLKAAPWSTPSQTPWKENNKRDETDFFTIGFVPLFYDPTFAYKRRNRIAEPAPTGSHQHGRTCFE
ncbi:hypothetical protein LOS15_12435 [Halomonas sp. 7T]|uniref:hypothetical protein n=1 Tax=Halomonas sp. 7T TaxID=2893469 RepID=UPI0021D94CB4|nr:hypothetical protein [Halomonas sp. 7T]UXZ53619.1 hypothetical protein LOS15_12435 [Halomonas sp. 7T]